MFNIKTINKISDDGINVLLNKGCNVSDETPNADGIIVRSANLFDYEINPELKAIARAGAGYNNIPVDKCSEAGIVVFNAPGANAIAVKEFELCSLILSSRDVLGSIEWVKSIADKGDEIPKLVEKGKSAFAGPEVMGKTMGVIGLGATGAQIANLAIELGMNVYGYDPFMSVDAAWFLSREIVHAESLDEIYRNSDYISLNVPFTESTAHMLNSEAFRKMRNGVRIINESRAEVVDDDAMVEALVSGKVGKYVTDFPNKKLIGVKNCICTPHLGACTPESEERCAVMAANQLYDYLENGNIVNSVNMPKVILDKMGVCRLCVIHYNVPGMINTILDFITEKNINVEHMINKARGQYAYTMLDLNKKIDLQTLETISSRKDIIKARAIYRE